MFQILIALIFVFNNACDPKLYTFFLSNITLEPSITKKLHFTPKILPEPDVDLVVILQFTCGELFSTSLEINFEKETKSSEHKEELFIELPETHIDYNNCIFTLEPDPRINEWKIRLPEQVESELQAFQASRVLYPTRPVLRIELGLRGKLAFSIPSTIPLKEYILHSNHPCLVFKDFVSLSKMENNTLINTNSFHTFFITGNKYTCKKERYKVVLLDPDTSKTVHHLLDIDFNIDDLIKFSMVYIENGKAITKKTKTDNNQITGKLTMECSEKEYHQFVIPRAYSISFIEKKNQARFIPRKYTFNRKHFFDRIWTLHFFIIMKESEDTMNVETILRPNKEYNHIIIQQPSPLEYVVEKPVPVENKQIIDCEVPERILLNEMFQIKCKISTVEFGNDIHIVSKFNSEDNKDKNNTFIIGDHVVRKTGDNTEVIMSFVGKEEGNFKIDFELKGSQKDMFIFSEDTVLNMEIIKPTEIKFKSNIEEIIISEKETTKTLTIEADKKIDEEIIIGINITTLDNEEIQNIKLSRENLKFNENTMQQEFNIILDMEEMRNKDDTKEDYKIKFQLENNNEIDMATIVNLPQYIIVHLEYTNTKIKEDQLKEYKKEKEEIKKEHEKENKIGNKVNGNFDIELIKIDPLKTNKRHNDKVLEPNETNNYKKETYLNNWSLLNIAWVIIAIVICVFVYRKRQEKRKLERQIILEEEITPIFY
eukprot:GAHX01001026.1.p1 GENE.GAHX01001026.1~~GAHX01001026.1.p1  ORF type:complete len:711 (-),score=151.91 GAHX01001026.1:28-2160(-)